VSTRWERTAAPRGDDYDARWRELAEAGQHLHGEADLVEELLADQGGRRVLDAGCGTGRVAIELHRRGFAVCGVDADELMLETARAKAPGLTWVTADLAHPDGIGERIPATVDLILLAGNVMIFTDPGTEGRVLTNLAARLAPGAALVAGFSLLPERLALDRYDELAAAAGLVPAHRWATWDRAPFGGGDYAVSVHRAPR